MKITFILIISLICSLKNYTIFYFKEHKILQDTVLNKNLKGNEILKKNILAVLDNYNYDSLKDIELNTISYASNPNYDGISISKSIFKYLLLDSAFSLHFIGDYTNIYFKYVNNKMEMLSNGKIIVPKDELIIENNKITSTFFEEKYFLNNNYKISYEGEDKINEIEVYKVEISNDLGIKKIIYYDKKTFLRIRLEEYSANYLIKKHDYFNYKKFDKIIFYTTKKIESSIIELTNIFDSVISLKINQGLTIDSL